MTHSVGIDVSLPPYSPDLLETGSICIVDQSGRVIRELTAETEPEALAMALLDTGLTFARVGLEAGPLSQWLHAGLTRAGLPVVLIETRRLIPSPIDQNPWAQSRSPMDMMRQG